MPQLGLTMTEGTVLAWLKSTGEPVSKGEPVVEIETDKVTTQIEAPADGVLGPILVPAGEKAPIGEVLSRVLTAGEAATVAQEGPRGVGEPGGRGTSEPGHKATEERGARGTEEQGSREVEERAGGQRLFATPRARRAAAALGIDLSQIEPSGPAGRIVEADVQWYADRRKDRTRIGTVPHFSLTVEVEAAALLHIRERLLAKMGTISGAHVQSEGTQPQSDGAWPTIGDILIKMCAQALREFPAVNVSWADENGGGPRQHPDVNIGVAMALEDGLVVPVIHQVDRLTLAEIARQRADLAERARAGKLTPSDLEGSAFTLSDLGMFRVDQFQAIPNPPQSAILAVGRIKERPVALAGTVVVRPTMYLTLSADQHRLAGAQAARFLGRIVELIEEPYLLLA